MPCSLANSADAAGSGAISMPISGVITMPTCSIVLKLDERFGIFDIISRHRRRKPAFRAAEQHARVTYPGGR